MADVRTLDDVSTVRWDDDRCGESWVRLLDIVEVVEVVVTMSQSSFVTTVASRLVDIDGMNSAHAVRNAATFWSIVWLYSIYRVLNALYSYEYEYI